MADKGSGFEWDADDSVQQWNAFQEGVRGRLEAMRDELSTFEDRRNADRSALQWWVMSEKERTDWLNCGNLCKVDRLAGGTDADHARDWVIYRSRNSEGFMDLLMDGEVLAITEFVLPATGFGGVVAPRARAGARLPSFCFAEGTQVLMADGSTKMIEEVQQGDLVLAHDPGEPPGAEPRRVTQVHRTATYRLFHVWIEEDGEGGEIVATGSHPFWTQRGWVAAEELTQADTLTRDDGQAVPIRTIAVESRDARTFNLSVEGSHSFFVVAAKTAVLVHNVNPWDVAFTRKVGVGETFQHGPWAGRTVEEAIGESMRLGRLADGLQFNAARIYTPAGEEIIATLNNRTLYVAQEARLFQLHPLNDIDSGSAFKAFQRQLALAAEKGGTGMPFLRCP
jgi:hypothetical protein